MNKKGLIGKIFAVIGLIFLILLIIGGISAYQAYSSYQIINSEIAKIKTNSEILNQQKDSNDIAGMCDTMPKIATSTDIINAEVKKSCKNILIKTVIDEIMSQQKTIQIGYGIALNCDLLKHFESLSSLVESNNSLCRNQTLMRTVTEQQAKENNTQLTSLPV